MAVMKLIGKPDGNNIVIDKTSFEVILTALATQKYIGHPPPNGDAVAMGKEAYETAQDQMQKDVDDIYEQAMNILHSK